MFLIRLDDASVHMDTKKWGAVDAILGKHGVAPIVGIIPNNEDPSLLVYPADPNFWEVARGWVARGWRVALHGYSHVYTETCGGINPVNDYSEFAGLPLDTQKQKIADGYAILRENGLTPDVFFEPAHTFDENTLSAIESEMSIRIISDTVASGVYKKGAFYYIPQQTGRPRKLPFQTVTICLHPNTMTDAMMEELDTFIAQNRAKFQNANDVVLKDTPPSIWDRALKTAYFTLRKVKKAIRKR